MSRTVQDEDSTRNNSALHTGANTPARVIGEGDEGQIEKKVKSSLLHTLRMKLEGVEKQELASSQSAAKVEDQEDAKVEDYSEDIALG